MSELAAQDRIVLAIDTNRKVIAERLMRQATETGAKYVKLGLELSSATSWQYCADAAENYGLEWIADAKLADIGNTVVKTLDTLIELPYRPFGITMHASSGREAMTKASAATEETNVNIFGVTLLTSITNEEVIQTYGMSRDQLVRRFAVSAVESGLTGLVCSAREVGDIKLHDNTKGLLTLVPGTRSKGASSDDQKNITTPAQAIQAGADLLVIGRQVTAADSPEEAYEAVVEEIEGAL